MAQIQMLAAFIADRFDREEGATMVEYGLLVALIAGVTQLKTAANALVLSRFESQALPYLYLVGALLMYQMFRAQDFTQFYPYVLAYMIAYMPTLALVNSISFRQLTDPSRQFSLVRVWGTVGWITAGLVISFVFHWDAQEAVAQGALDIELVPCGDPVSAAVAPGLPGGGWEPE